MSQWLNYHSLVGGIPNDLTVKAVEFVEEKNSALDIGAGNLRDSAHLRRQGFKRVVAVDPDEEALLYERRGIELHVMPIKKYVIGENTHDLIICCNVFFHMHRNEIDDVIHRSLAGLQSRGIFAANVSGMKNNAFGLEVNPAKFSIETIVELTKGFEVLAIGEEEYHEGRGRNKKTAHLWNMIFRKP